MKVPTYQESEKRILNPDEQETVLDVFIYQCSPSDYYDQSLFRWHLQRVLDHMEAHEV